MSDESNRNSKRMTRQELIALSSSAIIIVAAVVYWGIQIDGVMEMLELAYG